MTIWIIERRERRKGARWKAETREWPLETSAEAQERVDALELWGDARYDYRARKYQPARGK